MTATPQARAPASTDELWAWTFAKSQKVKNLERDPRATLQVEDGEEYQELRGVVLYGRAQLIDDFELACRHV